MNTENVKLTDTQLDLLMTIARRNSGFPAPFVKHLKPDSRSAFNDLVQRRLLHRAGETYIATADAYLCLESSL